MPKPPNFIRDNLGFSRQQLYYWRKLGIISPSPRTSGGHYRYHFDDLKILKTIRILRDAGLSTYRIRTSLQKIKKFFPDIENPLLECRILIFGRRMVFLHKGRAYDALTGQTYLLDFKKIERWAGTVMGLEKYKQFQEDPSMYFKEVKVNIN